MIFPNFDCNNAGGQRHDAGARHHRRAVVLRAARRRRGRPATRRSTRTSAGPTTRSRGAPEADPGVTGRPRHPGAGLPRSWSYATHAAADEALDDLVEHRLGETRVAGELELRARAVEAERLDPRALGAEHVGVGLRGAALLVGHGAVDRRAGRRCPPRRRRGSRRARRCRAASGAPRGRARSAGSRRRRSPRRDGADPRPSDSPSGPARAMTGSRSRARSVSS